MIDNLLSCAYFIFMLLVVHVILGAFLILPPALVMGAMEAVSWVWGVL